MMDASFLKPCDRDPPTRNFKNIKMFQNNSLKKLLTFTFGEILLWGNKVYFWGNKVCSRGFSKSYGFWSVFFLLLGVGGSVGRGPSRGFRKELREISKL